VLPSGSLEKLATALSDQFAMLYDVRPADPRARFDGDVLTFSFEGGLTPADEALVLSGQVESLRDFRDAFFEAVGKDLRAVVGTLTGAEVAFFAAAFDAGSETTNCYFTLQPDPHTAG
jgi:hypothetical protein